MKKLLLLFMIVPTLTFAQGGVGAGSGGGRGRYSAVQGFIVRHSDALVVTEVSTTKTRIDNSRTSPRRVSKIEFETIPNRYTSFEALESELRKRHPRRTWERIELAGAKAVAWLRRDEGRLRGLYYIQTKSFTLIRAELDAYAEGQGIALIEPIVRSFAYDHEGPTLHELKIDGPVLAGNSVRLRFRVTDDLSGIDTAFPVSGQLMNRDASAVPIEIHGMPFTLEDEPGWYAIDFPVNIFQVPGEYVLSSFGLTDQAGNSRYYALWRKEEPLKSFSVEIANDPSHSDAGIPRVHELRMSDTVRAGEQNRVLVRVTDDLSGIDEGGEATWTGFGGVWIDDNRWVRTPIEGRITISTDPGGTDPGEWFELDFELSPFLPAGRFQLDEIWIKDRAGNQTRHRFRYGQHRARVIPTAQADDVPPKVVELRIPGPLRPGSWGQLYLRVDEKGAGLDPSEFFAVLRARDFYGQSATIAIRDGLALDPGLGDGWYSISFLVNEHVPAGSYYLDWLKVRDLAGHRAGYMTYGHEDRYRQEHRAYERTPLRVLWTRIER
jgi:hypothetical protein